MDRIVGTDFFTKAVNLPNLPVEYKYIIVHPGGHIQWEENIENRTLASGEGYRAEVWNKSYSPWDPFTDETGVVHENFNYRR
jgi:hypothetical protein